MTADPGTADRLAADLAPEFSLLRLLGAGVMAHVYLARDAALNRLVAIKVLRREFAADAMAARRFRREATSAARITHPNVAAIYRVGSVEADTPYIVMEYVVGRTLQNVLDAEGPFSADDARSVLVQLAAALDAAHRRGIVHRDVRPGNILVEKDTGRVVLTDFGIAALVDSGAVTPTRLTPLGDVLGDPRYLSPEQLLGNPVDEEADVYSLGVVGYELLTREAPYAAVGHPAMILAHLQQQPLPLSELRPDVGEELAQLLGRCLAKKPEHRPRASELSAALAGKASPVAVPDAFGSSPFGAFLGELQRRRVYRVAAAYGVGLFAALEGADIVLTALKAPASVLPALVLAGIAGFPVVLVLTWIFDVRGTRIRRTRALPTEETTRGARRVRLALQALGLALSLVVAVLLGLLILR